MQKTNTQLAAVILFATLIFGAIFFSSKHSDSQGRVADSYPSEWPFQKQVDIRYEPGTFVVPATRILCIEYVSILGGSSNSIIELTTTVGGSKATYWIPASTGATPGHNVPVRIYADPNTTVTISGSARNVTVSGYTIRSSPR